MKILTFDTETTTFQKGNPFSRRNKLCYVGVDLNDLYWDFPIEYDIRPYGEHLKKIINMVQQADLIVGFNLKFDLHWLRRYEPFLDIRGVVWDCQLAEFILSYQRNAYPTLNESAARFGLGSKLDSVSENYWNNGIDTPDVPEDTLRDYLKRDVELTKQLYFKQYEELHRRNQLPLMQAQCEDLLILWEMEHNGQKYNAKRSLEESHNARRRMEEIDRELGELVGFYGLNWNSDDHVSAVLYGGSLPLAEAVPTQRVLKNGTVKHGTKQGWVHYDLPRLVEPLENTETKPTCEWDDDELQRRNEGREKRFFRVYSVGEPTLKSVKARGKARTIIGLLLERTKLAKLDSTYYSGLPALIEEMDWPEDKLHGQFNQCVAVTGRLSSSRPNQQNFAGDIKFLFESEYAD